MASRETKAQSIHAYSLMAAGVIQLTGHYEMLCIWRLLVMSEL